jgi:ubiquinone/menaquinone biosynthesis C-methylase UbiE
MKNYCIALIAASMCQLCAQPTDEALFFNPFVEKELSNIAGKNVLDMGSALSEWAPIAAKKGAQVTAVEEDENSLKSVAKLLNKEGLEHSANLVAANMHALPFESNHFDYALSSCVGAGLPSALPYDKQEKKVSLLAHCKEISRVVKEGGRVVIAAPASYDVVFTDGENDAIVQKEIEEALDQLSVNPSEAQVQSALNSLDHVNRATFVMQGDRLALLKDQKSLKLGQQIWRKEPKGVFLTYFHSEEEFLIAFREAGLFAKN